MNQFIFDKLTSFNQAAINDFHAQVTDYLPNWADPINVYGAIIPEDNWNTDNDAPIWGETDNGFWWCRLYEAVLVEDPGVVQSINVYHTQQYIDFCNTLSNLPATIPNQWVFPKLVESETVTLSVDNHVSAVPAGTNLFYTKFNVQLGESIYTTLAINPSMDVSECVTSYIDNVALIFSLLADANSAMYPRTILIDHQLLGDTNSLFLLPALSVSKQTSFNFHLAHLTHVLTDGLLLFSKITPDSSNNLLTYARQKWQTALKI